jgi:N4-gp56 family major capsid protein
MATTTTTVLNNLIPDYYNPKLLITLQAEARLKEFAVKAPLPEGNGKQAFWNARRNFGGPSVSLAEGGNPTAAQISSRRVSTTIAQYARVVELTDLAKLVTAYSSMELAQDSIKEAMMENIEFVLHMGIFKAAYYGSQSKTAILSVFCSSLASAFCANTGTNTNSNKQFQFPAVFATSATRLSMVSGTAPSVSAGLAVYGIRKATRRLTKMNALPMADGLWVGYTHPNSIHDLKRDPVWKDWNQYQNSKETMYKGEAGNIDNVRFVQSTLAPQYRVAARSVNLVFIFGKEAFGLTELAGAIDQYVIGGPDSGNLVNTKGWVSYKYTAAAATLNPSAGVILVCHERVV